jgi:hypothetical protein
VTVMLLYSLTFYSLLVCKLVTQSNDWFEFACWKL